MHAEILWTFCAIYFTLVRNIFAGVALKNNYEGHYCSNRLENALEHIVRRTRTNFGGRTYLDLSPYFLYHSLYGGQNSDGEGYSSVQHLNEKLDNFNQDRSMSQSKEQLITKVEVAELRVRLPQSAKWVHVDKCHFTNTNQTLDTRLIFPDLTISGKVILHPVGGTCNMILRLRHAGIDFRTIPLTSNEEARRNGAASIRTDSHFSEPGFLSVFAYGCQKSDKTIFRPNSKRKHIEKRLNNNEEDYFNKRYSHRRYDNVENGPQDIVNFRDNIIDSDIANARTFSEMIASGLFGVKPHKKGGYAGQWYYNPDHPHQHFTPGQGDSGEIEINDSMQRQLEQLFSMGVRSLLTTYLQKALQPAIKETLMENMGYTLSYG